MGHAPILSPACMLTLPWFLFNSQEAMTCSSKITKGQRKGEGGKTAWQQNSNPILPKEIKGGDVSAVVQLSSVTS